MTKHYVEFFSPGTFVAETSVREIDSWDVEKAKQTASEITERYNSKPYGFQFFTRERTEKDFDPKETKRSGMYYLSGKVLTVDDVKRRNDPKDRILISNMECNGYAKIVESNTPWRWTQPLKDGDTVLEATP